jgi:ATP phosphoribosyltransferase
MDSLGLAAVPGRATAAALVVLPKGRLREGAERALARVGVGAPTFAGRRLLTRVAAGSLVLARGRDVPLYVRSGAAELGIVGHDVVLEDGDGLVELCDLGFGACRLVFAAPSPRSLARPGLRVASRYPRLAASYLARRGLDGRVVALAGAVEAAVEAGLADAVVDVVETGRTLAAHGLVALDTVARSSARLVAAADRPLAPAARTIADGLRAVNATCDRAAPGEGAAGDG